MPPPRLVHPQAAAAACRRSPPPAPPACAQAWRGLSHPPIYSAYGVHHSCQRHPKQLHVHVAARQCLAEPRTKVGSLRFSGLQAMDWLSRQLWAAPTQSARPYYLTERLLACVYGEALHVGAGSRNSSDGQTCWHGVMTFGGLQSHVGTACTKIADSLTLLAEEDRESWNKSYRQTFLSDAYKQYLQTAAQELRTIRNGPGGVLFCNLSPAW